MTGANFTQNLARQDLAQVLDVSPRHVSRLVKEDILLRNIDGTYPLAANVARFVAHAVEGERRKAQETSGDRLKEARRLEVERKMARDDRKIIALDEAVQSLDEMVGVVVMAFEALPKRATTDRNMQMKLQHLCDEIRGELANHLAAKARDLRQGKDA